MIENGNVATINLNGYRLEAENMYDTLESFIEIKDGASLTIEGNDETISYTSANAENELFINYGNLTLSNININSDSDMLKLKDVGSVTKIENCELTAENDFCYVVLQIVRKQCAMVQEFILNLVHLKQQENMLYHLL